VVRNFKTNALCPVKCLQIHLHVDKCIWCIAAVLGHEEEVNQDGDTVQSTLEIVIMGNVWCLECGPQYGRNTWAEVAHLLSLPLCNFTIGLFWYAKSRIRRICFPGIVVRLLPFMRFPEPHHLFHHMFE